MDKLSPEKRSEVMGRVKGKNTTPELRVRSILHRMGFRFRLHRNDLPGNPDIVLPKYRLCIFVNGCFWHQHSGCRRATIPSSNVDFWRTKFRRTKERDHQNITALSSLGWHTLIVWECETNDVSQLRHVLVDMLTRCSENNSS